MTHHVVVGLGFGDEAKGATVDYLSVARARVRGVVRFSGGPQTLHHVVLGDGRTHGFSQFGSATLRGVQTFHSRFSMINPFNMATECDHLVKLGVENPMSRVMIDENALLITPLHRAANRARELARGAARHGSCGQGVGEARQAELSLGPELTLRVGDLRAPGRLLLKLNILRETLLASLTDDAERDEFTAQLQLSSTDSMDYLVSLIGAYQAWLSDFTPNIVTTEMLNAAISIAGSGENELIFEGTQGVLLDEWHGFHPHTTWSTTTFQNAETVLTEAGFTRSQWRRIGLTRSYGTRHGAGPLPGEDPELLARFPEPHNKTGVYQGEWRVAPLDVQLLRYAVDVCGGVDELVVSHLDAVNPTIPVTLAHDFTGERYPVKTAEQLEDLTAQEALTTRLKNLGHADLITAELTQKELISTLQTRLEAPVTITSTGPTADDRVYAPFEV
jgi:adenylosuccinate synthase